LKYFRRKIFGEKSWRFLNQTAAGFCKNLIKTLAFVKSAIFCRKLAKNAEKM
jgi:hypothetical protein